LLPATASARIDFSDTYPSLCLVVDEFFFLPGGFCQPAGSGSSEIRRTMQRFNWA